MLRTCLLAMFVLSISTAGCAIEPESVEESIEVQELTYEPQLVYSGQFYYSSGLGGTSYDTVKGDWCPTAYVRNYGYTYTYNSNGGYCSFSRWYSNDSSDCRMIVHVGASAFKHGYCVWQVYADQVFYVPYTTSNTNNAQQNTIDTNVPLQGGMAITIGTCGLPSVSGSGDTYIRLIGPNGLTAAVNDDSCGLLSNMTYTVPPGGDGVYTIKAGCYSSGSCNGTLGYSVR